MNLVRSTILAIAACTLLGSAAVGQQAASGGLGARPDSARVLRAARAAQAAFERVRYRNFPWTESYTGGGGTCDEHVGRFCIWHDDLTDDWEPPPERDAVKRERAELIAALDSAAAASPGDAWIDGQRVRYLVEAGRPADAVRAADACRAERWWCLALRGYALHFAPDYLAAAAAFAAAIQAMPPAERREWEDLAPAVADEDARALRRMTPAARAAAVGRLWWLADPFWMQPGNDRLTEHYARLVADRFQDRARTTEGLYWADDLREILVRWGQPSGWERVRPRMGQTDGGIVTHYASSFQFIPTLAMVRDPFAILAAEWKTDEKGAHSAYAPPGVRRLAPLPHQLAVFRRDGRAEVVAAFAMKPDSLPADPVLDAGAVLMRDADAPPVAQTARVSGTRGVLRLRTDPTQAVVSIEAREAISRRAARARFGVDLRRAGEAGLSISDVLLLDRADARPASLDEAAPLARGTTDFAPGDRMALYWEVYGLRGGADSVTFSVALARRPPGAVRRAAESIGFSRAATPVRMRWVEEPPAAGVLARSLAIALPRVPPGDYVLEVGVRTRSGASAFTRRDLTVRR
ncbi:MAG: hypothetical protein ACJ8GN_06725 [Longimicrobiaceae bacterium]